MIDDRRKECGTVWNVEALCRRYGIALPSPGRPGAVEGGGLDEFLYQGFRAGGPEFLEAVEGRFACAHWDPEREVVFLARDWIGETPLHWLATSRGFVIGNTLSAVRDGAGLDYSYRFARAFPQAKFLEIDVSHVEEGHVAQTSRYRSDALYYDFAAACDAETYRDREEVDVSLGVIRAALGRSLRSRLAAMLGGTNAVLLSGGLDSFSVALELRSMGVPFVAYTLAVEGGGDDVWKAAEFARHLGVEHRTVRVSRDDVISVAAEVVGIADTYHLYNYYCSIGMYLLGRRLADDGVEATFCGEAVNEALGDYHDWSITDPDTGRTLVLQHIDYDRMAHPGERLLYVWGQSHDRGKYNHQLGTGLAKHAAARMFKPFLHFGIRLECPYYDRRVLAHLVALSAETLHDLGDKPGLFARVFAAEMERLRVPTSLVNGCAKVRFQDASEGGRGGITPILFSAGYDQVRLITMFNECFFSGLDPELEARRLSITAM